MGASLKILNVWRRQLGNLKFKDLPKPNTSVESAVDLVIQSIAHKLYMFCSSMFGDVADETMLYNELVKQLTPFIVAKFIELSNRDIYVTTVEVMHKSKKYIITNRSLDTLEAPSGVGELVLNVVNLSNVRFMELYYAYCIFGHSTYITEDVVRALLVAEWPKVSRILARIVQKLFKADESGAREAVNDLYYNELAEMEPLVWDLAFALGDEKLVRKAVSSVIKTATADPKKFFNFIDLPRGFLRFVEEIGLPFSEVERVLRKFTVSEKDEGGVKYLLLSNVLTRTERYFETNYSLIALVSIKDGKANLEVYSLYPLDNDEMHRKLVDRVAKLFNTEDVEAVVKFLNSYPFLSFRVASQIGHDVSFENLDILIESKAYVKPNVMAKVGDKYVIFIDKGNYVVVVADNDVFMYNVDGFFKLPPIKDVDADTLRYVRMGGLSAQEKKMVIDAIMTSPEIRDSLPVEVISKLVEMYVDAIS